MLKPMANTTKVTIQNATKNQLTIFLKLITSSPIYTCDYIHFTIKRPQSGKFAQFFNYHSFKAHTQINHKKRVPKWELF